MKKQTSALAVIMLIIFILAMMPSNANTVAMKPNYQDNELARAVSVGVGTYRVDNPTVTYSQFFKMLDGAIGNADPSKLAAWKAKCPALRKSNRKLTRFGGMIAVYLAAETLGKEYLHFTTDWIATHHRIGEVWDTFTHDPTFSSYYSKEVAFEGNRWSIEATAYFYAFGRTSPNSGQTIFDYDPVSNSMRPNAPLTYKEALLAALRLADSGLKPTERVPTQQDAIILKKAEGLRSAILNSKTDVVVEGTSYYVSNSGDDSRDGKTPETAWATIRKINGTEFDQGDAVFFERGGIWREKMKLSRGITFSAYGSGEKPRIYGSPENGASPEKWELLPGTKNIWVFSKDMYDTGGIVFDEGKTWAVRKTAIWDGHRYVDVVDRKTPIDVKQLKNQTFFHAVDYTGYATEEASVQLDKKGKIYMRCDSGNPGSVYRSIEFLSNSFEGTAFLIQADADCTLDNLCLKYGNGGGIGVGSNTVVQNCEIAWTGGQITNFNGAWLGTDATCVIRCGDGIQFYGGEKGLIVNNYVHHIYDNAITVETVPEYKDMVRFARDVTIRGNLVEASSGDLMIADWHALQANEEFNVAFENILFESNYLMKSGYGWSHQERDYDWGTAGDINNGNCNIFFGFPARAGKNILVKNNVLYLSRYALVGGKCNGDGQNLRYQVKFSGNTYAQNPFGTLAEWQPKEDFKYAKPFPCNMYAEKTIKGILGDATGNVLY